MNVFLLLSDFIVPFIIFLIVCYGILMKVPAYDTFVKGAKSGFLTAYIGFPGELVPLAIVKMFSSSAASGLLLDVYKEYGTDSFLGLTASIAMSCTETIFYTMSVYFMSVKITKTRYTLAGALAATGAGLAASVVLAGMMVS